MQITIQGSFSMNVLKICQLGDVAEREYRERFEAARLLTEVFSFTKDSAMEKPIPRCSSDTFTFEI